MTATSDLSEGPVLTIINKRIHTIRRKLNRITEIEQQNPRMVTNYDNDLLLSKPLLMAVVDELEKLRQQLTVAVGEELKNDDVMFEDLIRLFYIGNLFNLKTKSEFDNVMLSRSNERNCCLKCDDVMLVEGDLDVVGKMSELFVSRPTAESSFSHEVAMSRCVDHARMLIAGSENRISSNNTLTYAGLRDLLAKIVGSSYYKIPPPMNRTADVDSRLRDLGTLVELKGPDGTDFQRNVDDHPKVHDSNYGDITLEELQKGVETGRVWTEVRSLTEDLKDQCVLFRGRVNGIRSLGKKMAFLTVRKRVNTVQCVLIVEDKDGLPNSEMLKYVLGLSKESLVDVEGVVQVPTRAIASATQQVEVKVSKIHCINRAAAGLPITLEDAARSKVEFEKALKAGKQIVHVNQDTRLNHRVLDLRTPANQAIFRLQSRLLNFFRQFLLENDFLEIITPKLVAGTSEGGASVFELNYFDQPASLTQSAQLYKQMAISADFHRVFVVGPSFRAEKSYTHRHLCEFTGLDVEMEIIDHYHEVMDIVDSLFVEMFDKLKDTCQIELDTIGKQYPFKPLKYLRKTLRLTFEEGIQMLQEAGLKVDPLEDLNTESERTLGKLVLEKYGTEFYILYRYPLAVRPFFTMPCHENKLYSNSFDVFMRGEEIISGSQRIHDQMLLESRAKECGVNVKTISQFIDSLRYGAPPRGGFGAGLERVVMLFCGLENIRLASLFPRDPRRLEP